MKAGTFNIHDYLGKLYEKVEEKDLGGGYPKSGSTSTEGGSLPVEDGLIIPEMNKKSYEWLKKEFQKGKTEVKVEMSYHEFKPGYHLDTNLKSVNDFKPGMYGDIKTSDTEGGKKEKNVPFPSTTFPGSGETKTKENSPSEKDNEKNSEKNTGIKVEAKEKTKQTAGKILNTKEDKKIKKEEK